MSQQGVLAIYLDGFDIGLATRLMSEGKLPALTALASRSARFHLKHGQAERSGLAGEHFSTGVSPARSGAWSDVHFDPVTYRVWQTVNDGPTFVHGTGKRVVVFDATHFGLDRTPDACGVTGWGAHGPEAAPEAKPFSLLQELRERFGDYPAPEWKFGLAWPDPQRCIAMGEALCEALRRRSDIATWLLGERMPDWDLAIVTSGELHSASEALWHGVDPTHPLHDIVASSLEARWALEKVYAAVDAFVGAVLTRFPSSSFVVFAMGGIGVNRSDLQSMALLPEAMYRRRFGEPLLRVPADWAEDDCPMLEPHEVWSRRINQLYPKRAKAERRMKPVKTPSNDQGDGSIGLSLGWMPATKYRRYWQMMDAFALPSFTDGRIRINLQGREDHGLVPLQAYEELQRQLEDWLRELKDPRTGGLAVSYIQKRTARLALSAKPADCDLMVGWSGPAQAFEHPSIGLIGPLPYNRTGGHTGPYGFAFVSGKGIRPGERAILLLLREGRLSHQHPCCTAEEILFLDGSLCNSLPNVEIEQFLSQQGRDQIMKNTLAPEFARLALGRTVAVSDSPAEGHPPSPESCGCSCRVRLVAAPRGCSRLE